MKLENKQYIVIGLGRFGRSVARELEANGCMVLAVDMEEKKVNMVVVVARSICLIGLTKFRLVPP